MKSRALINKTRQKGIAVLVTACTAAVVVPMVGLSVDVGIMYVVKTKLSAATDAAALAGARSLSRGIDITAQTASATATASNYFRANFPDGFLMTTASSINTAVAAAGATRTVSSSSTATVPTLFLRMLPNAQTNVTVNSFAQATRRDSNVVLVMDRSASIQNSGSCGTLKAAAAGFVDKFAETRDYLGLATFASSAYYMDFPIATNFKSATPSMPTISNSITCIGGTNSATGLWNGYTSLANLGQPGALNVIVFFTDGNPSGYTGFFPIKPTSGCPAAFKPGGATPGIMGVLTFGGATPWGLLKPNLMPVPVTASLENQGETVDPKTGNSVAGCGFSGSASPNPTNDISGAPATGSDIFGDTLNSGYKSPVDVTTGTGIENASFNAADEAARHIRNGDAVTAVTPGAPAGAIGKSLSNVVIFSIGLGNAATPPDAVFLKRVANTTDSPIFDNTKQTGTYVFAQTAADLNDAFEQVAAEILHLSK